MAVHFREEGGGGDSFQVTTWSDAWSAIEAQYRQDDAADAPCAWAVEWTEGFGPRLSMHMMALDIWEACCQDPEALRLYCLINHLASWDLPIFEGACQ